MAPNVQIPGEEDVCVSQGNGCHRARVSTLLPLIPGQAAELLGTADSPQRQTQP